MTPQRGKYNKISPKTRASVGKYAAENGTPKAISYFKKEKELELKESSVRYLKKVYLEEKSRKRKLNFNDDTVDELVPKKRGRRLMLGDLDEKIQLTVQQIRSNGGIVNSRIVRAIARGHVLSVDRTLLFENGGHVQITRDWSLSFMKRLKMVKRRGSSTSKPQVDNFDELKQKYLDSIKDLVQKYDIPPELIINFDHTGVRLLPVSQWTMETKGSEKVEIVGLDDKRQITGVMAGTLSGKILPPQVIYQGKTSLCHAKYKFPSDWHITHTPNHWANSETSFQYLEEIIVPYVTNTRDELDLPLAQKALIILDFFTAQLSEEFRDKIKSKHLVYVYVPPNCTDKLQPMDLSVQKIVKDRMREKFEDWYAEQIATQLNKNVVPIRVDLAMSVLKPLSAKWLVSAYDYIKQRPEKVFNGFKAAGIAACLDYNVSF